jgi:hypothetical protein
MMADREKLVDIVCGVMQGVCVEHCNHQPCYCVATIVDALIANGVTVQEWIPVEDRLPEEKSKVLVFWFGNVHEVTYLGDGTFETLARQCVISGMDVTHWMPLPEPPREE